MNKNSAIEKLLDQVGVLPPMPLVARKATEVINDQKSSMADLANVIKLDPAMSSLILRWVNSAYYALRHSVISIEQAIMFLGQRTVQNLILSASVASFMGRSLPVYDLQRGALWEHAVGTAAGSRLIAQVIAPKMAEDVYYAGLFHDVGKLAFDVQMRYSNKNYHVPKPAGISFQEYEIKLFGFDHAEVSAAMARRWNLPEHLVTIIQYHHNPAAVQGELKPLAYAVHAADVAMLMLGIGVGVDGLQYPIDPNTAEIIKWDEDSYGLLVDRILPVIAEAETFLKK